MMPMELAPGSTVGPWRVIERLDWGNYGVVFLAQRAGHPESPPVALKMARNPRDPRFEREGHLLQRLPPHPSIPRYEDSGLWTSPEGDRHPYVVMELVEGFTLYDWSRDDREARGTAEQLAREVEVLVQTAGSEADKPILPTASALPVRPSSSAPAREERCPRREPLLPLWLSYASAIAVGCFLVFLGWEMHRTASEQQPPPPPWIAASEEVKHFAPDAGVGEEAPSVIQDVPHVVTPLVLSVGAPMPKKPQQGQKRPPCGAGQVAVNGACWAGPIKGQEAPCPPGMFDHEGECYFAVFDTPRQPTSDQP